MEETHDFQFILPLNSEDLVNSRGDHYYVKEVYSSKDIPEKLLECKRKVCHDKDAFYILDTFDTYYSVIESNATDTASLRNLMRSFDLLYMTVEMLGESLKKIFADKEPPTNRIRHLNLTKMTFYLQVNVVKKIDSVAQSARRDQQMNLQKKRGKQPEALDQYPDWDEKRGQFLVQLFNILQLPLERLWAPPIAEEDFITMLCDICYRTLELTPMRHDNRHVFHTLFQILGTCIKRFNHALTFPVRILQILRGTEHAAAAVANGILTLHQEYGISKVFEILLKSIVEALQLDSADTTVSKHFSTFLSEFSSISPELIMPHLSKVSDELLDCQSHMLRNTVLQILADAVISDLTAEDLSDEMKEVRNEFLDHLYGHIMDVSAHVRTKALHIWVHLKTQHAVPLTYLTKVLAAAVGRLEDKSSLVRKAAMQLIKSTLESNPFSSKLSLEELIHKHQNEVEIMEKLNEVLEAERKEEERLNEQWGEKAIEILPEIKEHLTEFPNLDFDKEESDTELLEKILPLMRDKEYKKAVVLVRKIDFLAGNQEIVSLLEIEDKVFYVMELLKTYHLLAAGLKQSSEEMLRQIKTVQFLKDSIDYTTIVTGAYPKLQDLLMSKTNTDVLEAVDLFTTGYMFGIAGTDAGMRKMLMLVWSSDKEKRDAVSEAYRRVLFTTELQARAHAIRVVQNLSKFLGEIDYGHYLSLETLVAEWVNVGQIDALVIQVLFERFTLKLEGTTSTEALLALELLIMASKAKNSIVTANTAIIEDIAVGQRARSEPRLFAGCLRLLVNSIDANNNAKYYKRHNTDAKFVVEVIRFFFDCFFHEKLKDFDGMATSVLEYIYRMCQSPDVLVQDLLKELQKRFYHNWLGATAAPVNADKENELALESQPTEIAYTQPLSIPQTQTQGTQSPGGPPPGGCMPVFLVSRFMFCIGYMTIKEMIFLDMDVYNNMKYREELTAQQERDTRTQEAGRKAAQQQLLRRTMNVSAMEVRKRLSNSAAEPQQEPDEDLVGATAEDSIADEIHAICEDMLIYDPNGLLHWLTPVIIDICKKPGEYRHPKLQQAATLTLARLMTVSSRFCESNMSFLMNILSLTTNIKIKCNTVVGLSDLTFRFPNIIEPWTGHFYAQLHETDTELRLTAVKMLSHLLLNEMIRVKSQISDMALCIIDENEEIQSITKEFFKEIANKSNILYNVLPDIISRLGDTNLRLEEHKYHIIMSYILGLIQKDRQIESLVEKLCLRFPMARVERQWRDIAYCLSLLTYNERSINKLMDNMQNYRDKVQNDDVYASFRLIISNTNKLAKPELKATVTEFETRLAECLAVKDPTADGADSSQNQADETRAANRTKAAGNRTKKGGRKPAPAAPAGRTTSRRGGRGRRGARVESSSDDASESDSD
ncbi:condensin complex subunit 1 [Drosophila miranda]|uniref:condensin complex subunit 1 n=1 Tax=Drosophila miranda TaxID=7229 RepID=UPI0007E81218|nr:condensin complex subunit 1 [Drosophila miranda]